jgi:hypothetical protein
MTLTSSFEKKVQEVTGLQFVKNEQGNFDCLIPQNMMTYREHLVFTQMGSCVLCQSAVASDHYKLVIDKNKINFQDFETYYAWKKKDIAEGTENVKVISEQTGVEWQANLGYILLFDEDTEAFYSEAKRPEKIQKILQVAKDNGYEWSFAYRPGQTTGIALYRETNNWKNVKN